MKSPMKSLHEFFKTHEWTKGVFARDAFGVEVHVDDPKAVSFCLAGGLRQCTTEISLAYDVLSKILVERGISFNIPNFNDTPTTTKKDILAVAKEFDKRMGITPVPSEEPRRLKEVKEQIEVGEKDLLAVE